MDKIQIQARIKKGGQGIIYRCSVKDNPNHEFAIKRITADDLNEVNRYLAAHYKANEIKHQNIAECYKIFLDKNEAFPDKQRLNIFMPYYKDGDLEYLIHKKTDSFKKKLPQKASSNQTLVAYDFQQDVLNYAIQICRGIHFLHKKNLMHRKFDYNFFLL